MTKHPPRIRFDLRALPTPLRYLLALGIVLLTVTLASHFGHDDPVPRWISDKLVPALGWIYLFLVSVAIAHQWRQRRKRTSSDGKGGRP